MPEVSYPGGRRRPGGPAVAIAGVVALALGAGGWFLLRDDPGTGREADTSTPKTATSGDLTFTVHNLACGKSVINSLAGDWWEAGKPDFDIAKTAKGQYCFLTATAKNVGKEVTAMDVLSAQNQKLFDTAGNEYRVEAEAYVRINNADGLTRGNPPGAPIRPGKSLVFVLPYDIPKTATPKSVEFVGGTFGKPVRLDIPKDRGPSRASINRPAAGDLGTQFTVKGIECGKDSVVNAAGAAKPANGQFCLVPISVRFVTAECRTFSARLQRLFDDKDREYLIDPQATDYVSGNKAAYPGAGGATHVIVPAKPGGSAEGILVYDVPRDATAKRLELVCAQVNPGLAVSLDGSPRA